MNAVNSAIDFNIGSKGSVDKLQDTSNLNPTGPFLNQDRLKPVCSVKTTVSSDTNASSDNINSVNSVTSKNLTGTQVNAINSAIDLNIGAKGSVDKVQDTSNLNPTGPFLNQDSQPVSSVNTSIVSSDTYVSSVNTWDTKYRGQKTNSWDTNSTSIPVSKAHPSATSDIQVRQNCTSSVQPITSISCTHNSNTFPQVYPTASTSIHNQANLVDDTNLILIIDNIINSWHFRNSADIKGELSKFFPLINFRLVYSLKAGGIALHLNSQQDYQTILNFHWPPEAFCHSGSNLKCHPIVNKYKLILKNVNPNVACSEIEDLLYTFTSSQTKTHRYRYRDTRKSMPVVRVTCTSEEIALKILNNHIQIGPDSIVVEKFKETQSRDITCFLCNNQGHIAQYCSSSQRQ